MQEAQQKIVEVVQQRLEGVYDRLAADPILAAVVGVVLLLHTLAWCRLFSKAGYSAALGLFSVLPPLALLFPFLLAFTRSPVERELRTLRGIQAVVRRTDKKQIRRAA